MMKKSQAIQLICRILPHIAQVSCRLPRIDPIRQKEASYLTHVRGRIVRRRRHGGAIRSITSSACYSLRGGDLRQRQFEMGKCRPSPQGCTSSRRQANARRVSAAVLQSDNYSRWDPCIFRVDSVASDSEVDLPPIQDLFHPSSPAITPVPCRCIRTRDQSDWEYALCILSA